MLLPAWDPVCLDGIASYWFELPLVAPHLHGSSFCCSRSFRHPNGPHFICIAYFDLCFPLLSVQPGYLVCVKYMKEVCLSRGPTAHAFRSYQSVPGGNPLGRVAGALGVSPSCLASWHVPAGQSPIGRVASALGAPDVRTLSLVRWHKPCEASVRQPVPRLLLSSHSLRTVTLPRCLYPPRQTTNQPTILSGWPRGRAHGALSPYFPDSRVAVPVGHCPHSFRMAA
jgi:hypothetical protein